MIVINGYHSFNSPNEGETANWAPDSIAIDDQMSPFIVFLVPISNGHSNHFSHTPTAVRRNQNRHPIAFHRACLTKL